MLEPVDNDLVEGQILLINVLKKKVQEQKELLEVLRSQLYDKNNCETLHTKMIDNVLNAC